MKLSEFRTFRVVDKSIIGPVLIRHRGVSVKGDTRKEGERAEIKGGRKHGQRSRLFPYSEGRQQRQFVSSRGTSTSRDVDVESRKKENSARQGIKRRQEKFYSPINWRSCPARSEKHNWWTSIRWRFHCRKVNRPRGRERFHFFFTGSIHLSLLKFV